MSGVLQRSVVGLLLFHTFINNQDNGKEYTLGKYTANTKQASVYLTKGQHSSAEGPGWVERVGL